ncbi:class I SAM-dependent methyltransferase [Allokutzneria albata]|uniref:Ubiquinone/menaquinone biosynthesis C-methylase UbiE n=1 Tax=Allokutzneria albata TaxID=211114 RepID=A0A1H0B1X4_ALLAB|nr:class I SAM-dependent methyltransferase [Allokutzneria albata]SDN39638.1 Ubiquinone/menaquinone biosynthesis C-methylase UbiE [Allokutzneria albata]
MLTKDEAGAIQAEWDRQQEVYLPYREEAASALVDLVRDKGSPVRVLDLAGGTGTLAHRLLARLPEAEVTLLDFNPVLRAIAEASLPGVELVQADLGSPDWVDALPHKRYDFVLTMTAMHCFAAEPLRRVYREVRGILVPGGAFANADRMIDDGLPGFAEPAGSGDAWVRWWAGIAAHPVLGPLVGRQGQSADFHPPVSWHVDALRAAGFAGVGTLWRRRDQAAVLAINAPGGPGTPRSSGPPA